MDSADRKRPQFGSRYLTESKNVFEHNAWDNVSWSDELQRAAEEKLRVNSELILPAEKQEEYENKADFFWDKFYGVHQNRFFKDRHWLFTEFPELFVQNRNAVIKEGSNTNTADESGPLRLAEEVPDTVDELSQHTPTMINIFEVGCGVGNTVFPILESNLDANVMVYCCDFSEVAVSLMKSNPLCEPKKCHPFVFDVTADVWDVPFEPSSLDFIILIFVLSAVCPNKMQHVVDNLAKYLKPGGHILFRDYGTYDMVELRFKPGHCLSEHFYVRGDGTRVYFFTEEEVHQLFSNAGLAKKHSKVDRRLQVNRGKLLTMYRVWVQAKYMKPIST